MYGSFALIPFPSVRPVRSRLGFSDPGPTTRMETHGRGRPTWSSVFAHTYGPGRGPDGPKLTHRFVRLGKSGFYEARELLGDPAHIRAA